jgi:hypothetical protein
MSRSLAYLRESSGGVQPLARDIILYPLSYDQITCPPVLTGTPARVLMPSPSTTMILLASSIHVMLSEPESSAFSVRTGEEGDCATVDGRWDY